MIGPFFCTPAGAGVHGTGLVVPRGPVPTSRRGYARDPLGIRLKPGRPTGAKNRGFERFWGVLNYAETADFRRIPLGGLKPRD